VILLLRTKFISKLIKFALIVKDFIVDADYVGELPFSAIRGC